MIADSAHHVLVNVLGYAEEPFDGEGGYDIYIMSYGTGSYGYTYLEDDGISYIQIDNDYLGYDIDPLLIMAVSLGHEYFHAIQMGYKPNLYDTYFFEMSSMWFEDVLVPDGNDYLNWIGPLFSNPSAAFGTTGAGYELGLFGHYLSSFLDPNGVDGVTNSTIIREMWERFSVTNSSAFSAVQFVLNGENYNLTFIEAWVDFITRNLYNGIYENFDNPFYYYIDQGLIEPIQTTINPVSPLESIELSIDNKSVSLYSFNYQSDLITDLYISHDLDNFTGLAGFVSTNEQFNDLNHLYAQNQYEVTNQVGIHLVYGTENNEELLTVDLFGTNENGDIIGCTDPSALNYYPDANLDDGSCLYDCIGENPQGCFLNGCPDGYICIDDWENNCAPFSCDCYSGTGQWVCDDGCNGGTCFEMIEGCTEPTACNYNPDAIVDLSGSCIFYSDCAGECGGQDMTCSNQIGDLIGTFTLVQNLYYDNIDCTGEPYFDDDDGYLCYTQVYNNQCITGAENISYDSQEECEENGFEWLGGNVFECEEDDLFQQMEDCLEGCGDQAYNHYCVALDNEHIAINLIENGEVSLYNSPYITLNEDLCIENQLCNSYDDCPANSEYYDLICSNLGICLNLIASGTWGIIDSSYLCLMLDDDFYCFEYYLNENGFSIKYNSYNLMGVNYSCILQEFVNIEGFLLGDVNGDGELNILDLVIIANMVLAGEYIEIADVNNDGELNILDIVNVVNIILNN